MYWLLQTTDLYAACSLVHACRLVNSAVHVWGTTNYQTTDNSRNNALVALLVFGDGWHSNHHAFEYSAAHVLEWWQVDFSYYLIRGLEAVGLAWDVKRPSEAQKEKLRIKKA
jgi:stearoyl-CoA desaturase (delta-9 desaturase)